MAFLQILTGDRAQELIELNPSATFIIGSAPDAHVRLPDADVAPRHAQIYPAQGGYWLQDLGAGSTVHNMRRLNQEVQGLQPKEIFIVGRAFLQFWPEAPPGLTAAPAASGGEGGADPERLAALESELAETRQLLEVFQNAVDERESELEAARQEATASNERRLELEQQLENVKAAGSQSDEQVGLLQQELAEERRRVEQQLEEAKHELVTARARLVEAEGQAEQLQRQLIERDEVLAKERKGSETARVDAKRLQVELGVAESRAKEQIEQAQEEAKARLYEKDAEFTAIREQLEEQLAQTRGELGLELDATQQALEAARAAIELLGARAPSDVLARDSVLADALDRIQLEPEARKRLETAISAEVEREGLRRYSGAVLSWAGRPERDVSVELDDVRARCEVAQLHLHLSLPAPADAERPD